MKVETDLRAGGVLEDANNEINNFVTGLEALLQEANAEGQTLFDSTNQIASSLSNCLSNTLIA
ncbi:MAG: hypothetical protein R3335_14745 [Anaerolineales bacterium]|nr:hypothetical protein [Anaerolineales bacterium]